MKLRNFRKNDADQVNRVALAAFEELQAHYDDWPAMARNLGRTSELANRGELVVAVNSGRVIGAVTYVGPGRRKASYFDQDWPIIRMLVVDPAHRGMGAGRALTDECVKRALRDGSPVIALHTSAIMTAARSMYLRMGFERIRDARPIHGVPYAVYLKKLAFRSASV